MKEPKLYSVALFAVYPEKRLETERATQIAVPVRLEAWAIYVDSAEEALERGVQRARELWPVSEGCFGHSASVREIKLHLLAPPITDNAIDELIM
jgi:hypothetical protein